ncbi:hypothetical protein IAD21_01429 [Abditibacteriota bacterium]|nr:hypothetical protein IAD21_01429 [Abditibacteriota bacterium]
MLSRQPKANKRPSRENAGHFHSILERLQAGGNGASKAKATKLLDVLARNQTNKRAQHCPHAKLPLCAGMLLRSPTINIGEEQFLSSYLDFGSCGIRQQSGKECLSSGLSQLPMLEPFSQNEAARFAPLIGLKDLI